MSVKVGVLQMSMEEKYEDNLAKVDAFLRVAAHEKADLVLPPELFERHYFCQNEDYDAFDYAEDTKSSPTLKHYQEMAKECHLVLPISFFEKAGTVVFNSLAMIDKDGTILGIYRKSHIPTGECYEEKFYFAPGDTGFEVFNTSIGRIGVGICWDQWFPEVARILTLKGAQLLVYPSAIGSEPVLPRDSKAHWQNTMKGHAAANIIPLLASNRVGTENGKNSSMTFFGSSFIADQHGEIRTSLSRDEEGLRFASFNLPAIDRERRDWGVFRDRRVDLYGDLLRLDATPKKQ